MPRMVEPDPTHGAPPFYEKPSFTEGFFILRTNLRLASVCFAAPHGRTRPNTRCPPFYENVPFGAFSSLRANARLALARYNFKNVVFEITNPLTTNFL
jgi:hypothetical protein